MSNNVSFKKNKYEKKELPKIFTNKYVIINLPAFNFKNRLKFEQNKSVLDLPFYEHADELRLRVIFIFWLIMVSSSIALIKADIFVNLLIMPASNVKFFQTSPDEFLVSTLKIAGSIGILTSSPILIWQVILFLIPGLKNKEVRIVFSLLISSLFLFLCGIIFSYFTLLPIALHFLLDYNKGTIEPFWSFDEYFGFCIVLFYSIGLVFQIPIIQILLGLLNIMTAKEMIESLNYIFFYSTLFAAFLTPSTDPVTQICLALVIILLYFLGLIILFLIK